MCGSSLLRRRAVDYSVARHRQARHQGHAHARSHHVFDGFQRRSFEGLADALGVAGKARELRADLQHMVAKAMPMPSSSMVSASVPGPTRSFAAPSGANWARRP